MAELDFHKNKLNQITPPPIPLVLQKAKFAYAQWLSILSSIAKHVRCGVGARVDEHFINVLEFIFNATYARNNAKLAHIVSAIENLDLLKFFLQIVWESRYLSDGAYGKLVQETFEIGKMLAGWKKFVEQKTPSIK